MDENEKRVANLPVGRMNAIIPQIAPRFLFAPMRPGPATSKKKD